MPFRSEFPIRTFHTDSFGHVNNARYLEIMEEARWQFAEHYGLIKLLDEENLGFIIIHMDLRFRRPVLEGDRIEVMTRLITLGGSSGEVEQVINRLGENKIASRSLFHFVLIDRETGASRPVEGRRKGARRIA